MSFEDGGWSGPKTGVTRSDPMFAKPTVLLVPLALLVLSGCGNSPPSVETKRDIERLPASAQSIWARGLSDNDIPSLARLRELRTLDFSAGNGVMPAKITDEGLAELAKLDLPHLDTLGWVGVITSPTPAWYISDKCKRSTGSSCRLARTSLMPVCLISSTQRT